MPEMEVKRMEDINILSDKYTMVIIETDEEVPIIIAEITKQDVIPAKGYRVRLTPNYN